ncbi:MAG: hypothetical protein LBS95_00285 [Mycoplasmataceae bacterium]|nr:hypothetical protein [Mycoplasmataceae bacterium]
MNNLREKDKIFSQLRWIFWLNFFSLIGFIFMIVSLFFVTNHSFFNWFWPSVVCLVICYGFSSLILLMTLGMLNIFEEKKYIIVMKKLGFIPLANIALLYIIYSLKLNYKREYKESINKEK